MVTVCFRFKTIEMKKTRRLFIKLSGILSVGLFNRVSALSSSYKREAINGEGLLGSTFASGLEDKGKSIIGVYGKWAEGLLEGKLPEHSYRKGKWKNIEEWRKKAIDITQDRLATPDLGGVPKVRVDNQYVYDGLSIEEISWTVPTGGRSQGIVLKPDNAKGKLPGIMAFHDHGGWKYFGKRKIMKTWRGPMKWLKGDM